VFEIVTVKLNEKKYRCKIVGDGEPGWILVRIVEGKSKHTLMEVLRSNIISEEESDAGSEELG